MTTAPVSSIHAFSDAVSLDGSTTWSRLMDPWLSPCLDDVSQCTEGFSLGLILQVSTFQPSEPGFLIATTASDLSTSGFYLRMGLQRGEIEVGVVTVSKLWNVTVTVHNVNIWVHLMVTWSADYGLMVYANRQLVGENTEPTLSTRQPAPSHAGLYLGRPYDVNKYYGHGHVREIAFWEERLALQSTTSPSQDFGKLYSLSWLIIISI